MDGIDRRTFLALLGAGVAATACSGSDADGTATTTTSPPKLAEVDPRSDLPHDLFALGVASGDPLTDRVMLWTRLVNDPLAPAGNVDPASGDVEVAWDVAADSAFTELVASGTATASAALAHSVHVDVGGLEPDRWYWYRFRIGPRTSPVGRTRTLPKPDADPDRFRFVVASCQDFQWGHYAAWHHVAAEEDLDAVFFLGDYVYEYSLGDQSPSKTGARVWANDVTITLDDYRLRYAQVRSDASLQRVHHAVPWIVTWDDHEVSNNYAGDVGQTDVREPRSRERRLAAYQAWYEHMPIRLDPVPTDFDEIELHRSFRFGSLVTAFVIETREFSDPAACRPDAPTGFDMSTLNDDQPSCEERFDESRTNLGAAQEAWLIESMTTSDTTWNVLANPTMFAGMNVGTREAPMHTMDLWDGYVAVRNRVLSAIAEANVPNPVIVTGDWHASFVLDVIPEGAAEPLMSEFVVTAISSLLFPQDHRGANDHIRYFRALHGYAVFTVRPSEFVAEYRYLADVWDPLSPIVATDSFVVRAGERVAVPLEVSDPSTLGPALVA